jgi:flagellar biosynthesis protein FlhF
MRLKSFTAETLPEAMRLIRDALGADAIILSTQPAETGPGVRVTAALEESPLDELDIGSEPASYFDLDTVAEILSFHRVPAGLFDRLIGGAAALGAQDSVMALAGAMDSEFTFTALPAPLTSHPTLLVGPPGAGKTATTAKLCARARLAGRECAIVTMDTAKSGGLAQAETFAKALDATLLQADRPEALPDAILACGDGHFIVIDTAGANPFLDADMERLKEAASASRAQVVLVLPAGGDAAESAESAAAFKSVGATAMIATRLDTARRFGGLLSAAVAGSLDLMAVSASPHIGDPLHPVNPVALARMFLPDEMAGTLNGQTQDLKQWSKL